MFDETTGPGEQNNAPEGQTTGEYVAFCQQCGKGLTNATIRRAGSAVYCEPCLVARLEAPAAGAGQAGQSGASGWTPVGAVPAGGAAGQPGGVPVSNEPSPWLAALLGLIPGVGAMYNGQYAKGVAHLVIFAVLDSLSHNVNDVFGLLVLGWIFYQVFDAYHTAKARRDGTPLPNPFGLNEIGDRMGFGRNWPGSAARPVTTSTTAGWASATAGPATATASQGPAGGPAWTGYVPPTNFGATATPPPPPAQPTAYAGPVNPGSSTGWTQPPYSSTYAGEPWRGPSSAPVPPMPPIPTLPSRRFPMGAAWLIALGLIFLMANLNASWRLGGSWVVALTLAALGLFILFRRIEMVVAWSKVAGDTDVHEYGIASRVLCQVRGPVMLLVLALLFGLQAAGIRTLGQTWGILLIALGGLLILERTVGRSAWYPMNAPVGVGPVQPADTRKDGQ